MKLLHVIAQLPYKTGSGVYFSNMIEEFKKYNYKQKAIFALQDNLQWDVLNINDQHPVKFKSKDLPFPIVGMSNVMPYENTLYSHLDNEMLAKWKKAFVGVLERVKKDFKPDIIFCPPPLDSNIFSKGSLSLYKVIGLCHNTDLRQSKMNPQLKDKEVKNIHKLDLVFSASDDQSREIEKVYRLDKDKILAIGGAFNQKIFYPKKAKQNKQGVRLVFSGKIDPSKGIYELIDLYRSLEIEGISLDIIGNPNGENKERIRESIGDDKSIRLYNVKDQLALANEIRTKDIFLMPSYYEGLGLMAIESLACGLYVVTTEIEALMTLLGKEIKDSGVIKFVPLPRIYNIDKPMVEDLPEFKENFKKALINQIGKVRKGEEFPQEIKDKIKIFSWQGLVENMNGLIKKL